MAGRVRPLLLAVLMMLSLAAPAGAAQAGGKAAGAGRFVGYAQAPASASAGGPTSTGPADSLVADAAVPRVAIYDAPGAARPTRSLSNPTREGVLLIFGVNEQRGQWLNVKLPMRPNGSTGWIKASDVKLRKVSNRVVVTLSEFKLRAYRGDQLLFETPVGIGKDKSPTPQGNFYIDIAVPFAKTTGPYGAFMLSVAGFSEVLSNFGGGVGQIAIHGTNNRPSVGVKASNGCLRLTNEAVLRLKDLAPTGTPVQIRA